MKNIRIKLKKAMIRIRIAFKVLFSKDYEYFYIVRHDEKDIRALISGEDEIGCHIDYIGMNMYLIDRSLFMLGNCVDEDELLLRKASFEVDIEEIMNKK